MKTLQPRHLNSLYPTISPTPLKTQKTPLKKRFAGLLLPLLLSTGLAGCDLDEVKTAANVAEKSADAQSVIWIGDFNNFDDAVALMILAKDPNYTLDLIVVEDSFNTVAHGANMVYNILEWLGNRETKVIRGAYFALDEVKYGANGEQASDTAVNDEHAVSNQADYQLPNSADFTSGTWNLERRNVMGSNLYGQFVPGPWRDNGSTLYGTDHLIPIASQESYHYSGNNGVAFNFELPEDIILNALAEMENPIVINTGKLTTFSRVLNKANAEKLSNIDQVMIMGGGFQGYEPFTADNSAACFGDRTLNLGGNIFSHPSFGCGTDFSTHQEFNIFLDPTAAQQAFTQLSANNIPTTLVPTNATDLAKVQLGTINELAESGATPEACYSSKLLEGVREFEGGDFNGNGDFALDSVIRLWDIVAALVLTNPDLVTASKDAYVEVDQLDDGLAESSTPYDPITFDPMVGKTTFSDSGSGLPIHVILGVDYAEARQAMIDRLRDEYNSALNGPSCD